MISESNNPLQIARCLGGATINASFQSDGKISVATRPALFGQLEHPNRTSVSFHFRKRELRIRILSTRLSNSWQSTRIWRPFTASMVGSPSSLVNRALYIGRSPSTKKTPLALRCSKWVGGLLVCLCFRLGLGRRATESQIREVEREAQPQEL